MRPVLPAALYQPCALVPPSPVQVGGELLNALLQTAKIEVVLPAAAPSLGLEHSECGPSKLPADAVTDIPFGVSPCLASLPQPIPPLVPPQADPAMEPAFVHEFLTHSKADNNGHSRVNSASSRFLVTGVFRLTETSFNRMLEGDMASGDLALGSLWFLLYPRLPSCPV